ncbi:hypothetical protein CCAX7_27360 [Capsulimonas corticalis]|uniref:Uncharacterized protein n=1 Tax=Capsulimonas corticalis TaxID=2219043 RepID=A0A402CTN1_9BACT|nr:Rieske (2Fe-2S) protein [Capsulimonas corticalis]BDI30685.1 hypothetical protein CCAX7_27360 [Capsulimonas corticalis]
MPEETTKHSGTAPVTYPADGPQGVSTPSDRLRRQLIKGGAGTVLAVAAVWAGWTKVLFPEGADKIAAAPPSPQGAAAPGAGPAAPAGPAKSLGAAASFKAGDPPKLVLIGTDNPQPYLVENLGGDQFRVLSALCTHKGCTVDWSAKDNVYICPCHYGKFSRDGKNVSGPPPSPLEAVPAHVENGNLVVS